MKRVGSEATLTALVVAALSLACSTTKEAPATVCTAYFSGDVTDTVTSAQCATTSLDPDAGGWTLAIMVQSQVAGALQVVIDLGATPVTGTVSSDTIGTWDAVTAVGADACSYGAGSTAVPSGSFTLAIQSVATDEAGDAVTLHGTLDLVTYVHAPPMTSCGPQEVENVEVRF